MLGGCEVQTAVQAAAYRSMLGGRSVSIGDRICEPPCVDERELERIRTQEGRECPRVTLHRDNEPAGELLRLALHEHTRPLATQPDVVALVSEGLGDRERGLMLLRVGHAMQDERVLARLYPKHDDEGADRG